MGSRFTGKAYFWSPEIRFKEAAEWRLQEGYEDSEQLHFVIGGEAYSWDELFYRPTDHLVIKGHGFKADGKRQPAKEIRIRRDDLKIGENTWKSRN